MKSRYWFITHDYSVYVDGDKRSVIVRSDVIPIHPFEWLYRKNQGLLAGNVKQETFYAVFALLFFTEIDQDEYNDFEVNADKLHDEDRELSNKRIGKS